VTEKRSSGKWFLRREAERRTLSIMRLLHLPAPDFDLARTLDSGQVFHWENHGAGHMGAIETNAVYVEQRGERLFFQGITAKALARYFSLDHPLAEICRAFPSDPAMLAAREFCRGLRIIRQPRWECLATFITSSMKQVAHIRQISHTLRKRYGARLPIDDRQVYAFPTPGRMAELTELDLRRCALGYRAKNLLATAQLVASGEANLERWSSSPDDVLRANLCGLPGVGAKVANCVMLFAYERLRAFPIDVWIERVLKEKYFPRKRKVTAQQLRAFCETYFGEHGGYAQQYLFHHARKGGAGRAKAKGRLAPQVVRPGDLRYYGSPARNR
jgi:N-glycosylase/DNA lyase